MPPARPSALPPRPALHPRRFGLLTGALGAVLAGALAGCPSGSDADLWELGMRLTAPTTGGRSWTVTRAELELDGLRLDDCTAGELGWLRGFSRNERPRDLREPTGTGVAASPLLDARARGVDLAAGTWCALDVVPAGPLSVEAVDEEDGTTVVLALNLPPLTLTSRLPFGRPRTSGDRTRPPPDLMVQWGDAAWMDALADRIASEAGSTLKVDAEADAHDALVAALTSAPTGLYVTADADAALSDDERAARPVASPAD